MDPLIQRLFYFQASFAGELFGFICFFFGRVEDHLRIIRVHLLNHIPKRYLLLNLLFEVLTALD